MSPDTPELLTVKELRKILLPAFMPTYNLYDFSVVWLKIELEKILCKRMALAVAAAYLAAAERAIQFLEDASQFKPENATGARAAAKLIREDILALTPSDASAALAKHDAELRLAEAEWWHFKEWSKHSHNGRTCEEISTDWKGYVASLYEGCQHVVELRAAIRNTQAEGK